MRINGISPISTDDIKRISLPTLDSVNSSDATSSTGSAPGSFGASLAKALDSVQGAVSEADKASELAALGKITPADYMTKAAESQLTLQLAMAVRNRAVEAFNEIMRMPV
jgi:flagellar hook-basal body complex protein FliE